MGRLKRGNWSTHDLERLRALYPRSREESVARLLRRSLPSVRRKAQEIFSRADRRRDGRREWTAEDDLQLREGFGVHDFQTLCLVLGRNERDVADRVRTLRAGVHIEGQWKRSELNLLKRLYGSRSDEDLVVCLSRPVEQVRAKAADLCLSKDKGFLSQAGDSRQPMPRWRSEEIHLLRNLYPTTPNLQLAQRLRRSVASVANKANQLGLKKGPTVLREMGRRNVSARYGRAD